MALDRLVTLDLLVTLDRLVTPDPRVDGAAVGPSRALFVLFLGAALGAVTFLGVVYPMVRLRGAPRTHQIDLPLGTTRAELPEGPFGVFLAPASVVALVWGDQIFSWYLTRVMTQ